MKQYNITNKQFNILLLLYRFRFLDTPTIQLFLNHKLPTRIQQWVHDLHTKGYIHQFYDRDSFVKRTQPAIYCLSTKARKILEEQKECDKRILSNLYREKQRSEKFQEHCCCIGKIAYRLEKYYAKNSETIEFFTRVELVGYNHFPQPLPDAYFALKKKGAKTQRYFLELFDEKIPKRFIKSNIRRYITSSEGEWTEEAKVTFPIILIIAQNQHEQKKITRATKIVLEEEYSDLSFYITTKEKILTQELTTDIWQKIDTD